MKQTISHSRSEETIESKARWFQSLPMAERMDIFCEITELALAHQPDIPDKRHAEPTQRRIRILSKA
ncbi:MAG TPA: hypothetical protein PKE12_06860 [Kiritimatiellia bacterium]|nr:hypothetical protein [Kiritimatiellia bacterium]